MSKPLISIIAAIGTNRELGKNNKLLWHIPDDLKHFKRLTSGHPVIMGRKTYESIGRPLPDRINIIITKNSIYSVSNCIVVHSLKDALEIAKEKEKEEIFIIGGGQIYKEAINMADKLYLTKVDASYDADTYFPNYSRFKNIISSQKGKSENIGYEFVDFTP